MKKSGYNECAGETTQPTRQLEENIFSHLPLQVDYFSPRPPALTLTGGAKQMRLDFCFAHLLHPPPLSILWPGGGGEVIHLRGQVAKYIFLQPSKSKEIPIPVVVWIIPDWGALSSVWLSCGSSLALRSGHRLDGIRFTLSLMNPGPVC